MKKIISLMVALVMVITMVPTSALAADNTTDTNNQFILEDGNYYVDVDLWHENKDNPSMGDVAFAKYPKALVKVNEGKATVQFATNVVNVGGIESGLVKMLILRERNLANKGEAWPDFKGSKEITVVDYEEMTTTKGNKYDFVRRGEFQLPTYAVPKTKEDTTYVNVAISVPDTPMDMVFQGGNIPARIKLAWATAEKTTDEKVLYKVVAVDPNTIKAPSKVTAKLSTLSGGYDDVSLSWTKSEGANGYYVYSRRPSKSSKWSLVATTSKTSYLKKNLYDGYKYQFKVVPYIVDDGDKYKSNNYRISNSITTLKKVSLTSVKKYNNSKARVYWKNIEGESGYQISKSTSKTKTYIVSTYKTTSGKSKVVTAKRYKGYYYKVRAYKEVNGKKVYAPWSTARYYKVR